MSRLFHDTEKKFLHIDIELKIKQARPNYDFEQVHEIFFFLRLTLKSVSDGEKWNWIGMGSSKNAFSVRL